MKLTAVLTAVCAIVCFAAQSVQDSWILGPGTPGPVSVWGSSFDTSDDISWLSCPGLVSLSSQPLATPEMNTVDFYFKAPYTVDVGDLNGDGLPDVVAGGYQAPEFCAWYADGQGGWTEQTVSVTAVDPCGSDVVDIDSDGDLDVLCATYTGGRILLFLSDGGDLPQWSEVVIEPDFAGAHDVEAWDIDGDGDMDVLGASALGDRVTWWRNDGGSPIQWTEQDIGTGVDYACRIQAVDLDGDGCTDVITSAWEGDRLMAWYGSGGSSPSWTEQTVWNPVFGAHSVRAFDPDADGDQDLLATALDEGTLLLFRNGGGSPVQWTREVVANPPGCGYARPGDFDGDGDQDIAACSFGGATGASWWENDGTGTVWTEHPILSGFGSMACALPADVDGNGALDVVLTCRSMNRIYWFRLTEFKDSGSLTSSILDTGANPQWASIDWDLLLPFGCGFTVSYRSSDDPGSLGSWSPPSGVPLEISGDLHRYFQYRLDMTSTSPAFSPVLDALELNWDPTGIHGAAGSGNLFVGVAGGNPVRGPLVLEIHGAAMADTRVLVYDCTGRLAWSSIHILDGEGSSYVQGPALTGGVYRIMVQQDDGDTAVLPVVIVQG